MIACSNGLMILSHLSKREQIITGIRLMAVGGFISIQSEWLISEVACFWKMVVTANVQQMSVGNIFSISNM